jgi:hypothetical protein
MFMGIYALFSIKASGVLALIDNIFIMSPVIMEIVKNF